DLEHDEQITGFTITRDGKQLISATTGRAAYVWDLASREKKRTLAFPSWYVGGVAVCPQGQMLALCGAANVRLIDLAGGDVKRDLPPTYLTRPAVMQFEPSGKRILTVAPTLPSLRIWDVATGTAVRDLEGSTGFLQQAAFSPNGWCVAATTPHGDVAVWEVAS